MSAAKTDRIGAAWVRGELLLNADIVLPQIAKVVLIQEAFVVTEVEIKQTHLGGIVTEGPAAEVPKAIVFALNAKPMEMEIAPIEGNLQRVMEIIGRGKSLTLTQIREWLEKIEA